MRCAVSTCRTISEDTQTGTVARSQRTPTATERHYSHQRRTAKNGGRGRARRAAEMKANEKKMKIEVKTRSKSSLRREGCASSECGRKVTLSVAFLIPSLCAQCRFDSLARFVASCRFGFFYRPAFLHRQQFSICRVHVDVLACTRYPFIAFDVEPVNLNDIEADRIVDSNL